MDKGIRAHKADDYVLKAQLVQVNGSLAEVTIDTDHCQVVQLWNDEQSIKINLEDLTVSLESKGDDEHYPYPYGTCLTLQALQGKKFHDSYIALGPNNQVKVIRKPVHMSLICKQGELYAGFNIDAVSAETIDSKYRGND